MAKRRNLKAEEKAPEQLSADERRAQHKRTKDSPKARARGRSTRVYGFAIGGGIAAAVVATIVVLLVFAQPHPCLSFGTPPGYPVFPPAGTTDFSGTWCPQQAPQSFQMTVRIVIQITTTGVVLPGNIGHNSSYPGHTTCSLPIQTAPASPGGPDSAGIVTLASPWAYSYNLSAFFATWSQSASGAYVNQSYPNQPIQYSANNLLGFAADPSHQVVQLIDGKPSSAGPALEMNSLPYGSSPYPSCITSQYGNGHVITLEYRATPIAPAAPGLTFDRSPTGGAYTAPAGIPGGLTGAGTNGVVAPLSAPASLVGQWLELRRA